MKLVSSNDTGAVAETVQKAIKLYRDTSDVAGALGILTQLKGIGPATASLLLAVHDAENVVFFADEAFYWLCSGGSKAPLKYNLKEYTIVYERAQALAKRLGVKAVDVERVAFVLMRQQTDILPAKSGGQDAAVPVVDNNRKPATKRKASDDSVDVKPAPTRRSKRVKQG